MKKRITKPGRRAKTPTFHTLETKLEAVRKVNTLINKGLSVSKAHASVAKPLKVTPSTIYNWCTRHNISITQVNTHNNVLTATGRLIVQSLNVKTADGANVRLTPIDIKGIAEYASLL